MENLLAGLASALWLGILTSISPCPLATNLVAVSYIGKDLASPRRVILSGLVYTVGRTVAYVLLAALLVASVFAVPTLSFWLQLNMNRLLGPVLLLVGLLLLDLIPLRLPSLSSGDRLHRRLASSGLAGAGVLGMVFALSFCPVSAALFFGSLLPLAISHSSSFLVASLYGAGTALPVCAFAILIAFSAQRASRALAKLTRMEKWARRITAVVFIAIGVKFCLNHFLGVYVI
jgi:cytochrome c-type biogenesis protein